MHGIPTIVADNNVAWAGIVNVFTATFTHQPLLARSIPVEPSHMVSFRSCASRERPEAWVPRILGIALGVPLFVRGSGRYSPLLELLKTLGQDEDVVENCLGKI